MLKLVLLSCQGPQHHSIIPILKMPPRLFLLLLAPGLARASGCRQNEFQCTDRVTCIPEHQVGKIISDEDP